MPKGEKAALYYEIRPEDTFEEVAQRLFELVRKAIDNNPWASRWLYVDIQGHEDPETGYDSDVCELLLTFIPQMLGPHLTRFPMARMDANGHLRIAGQINNPRQTNNLPPALTIGELEEPTGLPWPPVMPWWANDRQS